jgi:tRNA 2-selenouridine synthase
MTIPKIDAAEFLELAGSIPVADVRSPSEYNLGHIPGAVNIPLFDDREREAVGIKYKKEGRVPAILEGLRHAGPKMDQKLERALKLSVSGRLLVHCWRGGMRSESMAWLFKQGGLDVSLLDGGYKSYRRYILEKLAEQRKMIILGGMTGSSKTHILKYLRSAGKQVIDLEGLSNHKGSAFGALGQPAQPSTEQFVNNLYGEWKGLSADEPLWLEDESRNIGSVFIPDSLYLNMQSAGTIVLMMDVRTRLPRLMAEYSEYPAEELSASIMKISKRLGGDNTRSAMEAVAAGDIASAIEISLSYYDKAYLYGLKKKDEKNLVYVETDTDDIKTNAAKILEAAGKIIT